MLLHLGELCLDRIGRRGAPRLLLLSRRRPRLLVALPVLVAVELSVNGLLGQAPSESLHGQIEIPSSLARA